MLVAFEEVDLSILFFPSKFWTNPKASIIVGHQVGGVEANISIIAEFAS